MAFHIAPCLPADVDDMVSVYIGAFRPSYMTQMLFPPTDPPLRTWLFQRFLKVLDPSQPEMHVFKAVETSTGKMAGWARWGYPYVLSAEEKAAREAKKAREDEAKKSAGDWRKYPEGANEEACQEYFSAMDGMREKWMKNEEDYILYFLATDPAFHRRGVGGMLLDNVTALADVEGRKIYLEATSTGHQLYERKGWRDVDLITIDLTRWGGAQPDYNWIMIREPQGEAGKGAGTTVV